MFPIKVSKTSFVQRAAMAYRQLRARQPATCDVPVLDELIDCIETGLTRHRQPHERIDK